MCHKKTIEISNMKVNFSYTCEKAICLNLSSTHKHTHDMERDKGRTQKKYFRFAETNVRQECNLNPRQKKNLSISFHFFCKLLLYLSYNENDMTTYSLAHEQYLSTHTNICICFS